MPTLVSPSPSTDDAKSLAPVPLEMELGGRLRNIGRPKHWYMAIAEAIKNSMDAIEEANETATRDGWIEVNLQDHAERSSKTTVMVFIMTCRSHRHLHRNVLKEGYQ